MSSLSTRFAPSPELSVVDHAGVSALHQPGVLIVDPGADSALVQAGIQDVYSCAGG